MRAPRLWLQTNGFCAAPPAPLLGDDLGADTGELTAVEGERTGAGPLRDGVRGIAGLFTPLARPTESFLDLYPVGQGMQVPRSAY
jgi:hypothetical protein